jgi:hypothetical protein
MITIPNTTLIIVDCVDADRAHKALEDSLVGCSFSSVKLLTSKETDSPYKIKIDPIRSTHEYSEFMLRHIYEYCDTLHMQIVQFDGWVINPTTWNDDWCKFDYMGALWDGHPIGDHLVGNGGFSFRSRRMMKFISDNLGNYSARGYKNEDGIIGIEMRQQLTEAGFKFCSFRVAARYSLERCIQNKYPKPFGFHSFYALKVLSEQ